MITSDRLTSPVEYARRIKPLLPERAFAPSPRKMLWIPLHLGILFACYTGIRVTNAWPYWLFFSLIIGQSIACLGFLAHEISHNSVIQNRPIRYFLEILTWGFNLITPTVWRRVHNQTHHAHPNTPDDPDRNFLTAENTPVTRWYSRIFYPNRDSLYGNLLVGLHFIPYITRNTLAVFYPAALKPQLVPYKPSYTSAQKFLVVFELAMLVCLQVMIYFTVGEDWHRFLFATPLAVSLTSCMVMIYIFTNHSTNPLCESNDPLASTTSVVVPPLFNRLHQNFSFHTEHHLFPGMSSEHYPKVCALLRKEYPTRYNRLRLSEAWALLWRNPMFADQVDNQGKEPCKNE